MNLNKTVGIGLEWSVEIHPAQKMCVNQLHDHYLGTADTNKVLDFGDAKQPVLQVSRGRQRRVGYEFIPEQSPPGFTIEQALEEMRKAGFQVRGVSADRKYIICVEDF